MTYFYKIDPMIMLRWPGLMFQAHYDALPMIEARQTIQYAHAFALPHADEEARQALFDRAYPKPADEPDDPSPWNWKFFGAPVTKGALRTALSLYWGNGFRWESETEAAV